MSSAGDQRMAQSASHSPQQAAPWFELSLDLMCVADTEGRFVSVNPSFRRVLGYEPEEMNGLHILDFIHPEDHESTLGQLSALRRGEDTASFENRYRCKDGSWCWLSWTCPAPKEDGLLYATAHDITANKQTEMALRDGEHRLQVMTDMSPALVFSAGPQGDFTFVLGNTLAIIGLQPEECLGELWMEAIHSEERDRVLQAWREAIETQQPFRQEMRFIHPEGQTVWADAQARPVVDEESRLTQFVGVIIDVSPHRRLEQEREELREEMIRGNRLAVLGELAAQLAHEINQPLYAIRNFVGGASQRLSMRMMSDADLGSIFERIDGEVERASNIVQVIRNYVRAQCPERLPTNINQLIIEVGRMPLVGLREDIVTTLLRLEDDLPAVTVVPSQIQQVLLNLCQNACESMLDNDSRNAILTISTWSEGGAVCVAVSDTGPGLEEDPETYFQTFFSTKDDGLGMGLSVCRTIIRDHGGKVWAEPNEDGGVTFLISLPAEGGRPSS